MLKHFYWFLTFLSLLLTNLRFFSWRIFHRFLDYISFLLLFWYNTIFASKISNIIAIVVNPHHLKSSIDTPIFTFMFKPRCHSYLLQISIWYFMEIVRIFVNFCNYLRTNKFGLILHYLRLFFLNEWIMMHLLYQIISIYVW